MQLILIIFTFFCSSGDHGAKEAICTWRKTKVINCVQQQQNETGIKGIRNSIWKRRKSSERSDNSFDGTNNKNGTCTYCIVLLRY